MLIKFRPETSSLSAYLLNFFGKDHQPLDDLDQAIKLRLKDNLDLKTTYATLRQFDRVIEWVKPNFIVKASAKTVKQLPLSATVKAALQSGAPSLDTMRGNQPQPPNAYQPSGSLPPAGYNDPKPVLIYAYLTQLANKGDATGISGSLPMQSSDPTAGTASVGGWNSNLDSQNYNFTAPVLSLAGRLG